MENVEHFFSYAEQVFSSANMGELYIKIVFTITYGVVMSSSP